MWQDLQKKMFFVCSSFNSQARYQQRSQGPIQQSTILVVDPAKGNILKASGRDMYVIVLSAQPPQRQLYRLYCCTYCDGTIHA